MQNNGTIRSNNITQQIVVPLIIVIDLTYFKKTRHFNVLYIPVYLLMSLAAHAHEVAGQLKRLESILNKVKPRRLWADIQRFMVYKRIKIVIITEPLSW